MKKQPLRVDTVLKEENINAWLGQDLKGSLSSPITGVCLDSRVLQPGDLFFALPSARDGHDFVQDAWKKGASAVIVEKPQPEVAQWVVPNTLHALWQLARSHRQVWGKTIMAISGSNGKTSTKEFARGIFGPDTLVTPGTWNNHLGVPLTLLLLQAHHNQAVLEMGINDYGELKALCEIALPQVSVLTSIGKAHLQAFGDESGVAKAKEEIFQCLDRNGIGVFRMDDPYIAPMRDRFEGKAITTSLTTNADIHCKTITPTSEGYHLVIGYGDTDMEAAFKHPGLHNVSNLLCVLGLAMSVNMPAETVQARIPLLEAMAMRMQKISLPDDRLMIVDCYNANPSSMHAGLQALKDLPGRKVALLGDMFELGQEGAKIHCTLGKSLADYGIDQLLVIGQFSGAVIQGALQGGMKESQLIELEDRHTAFEKIDDHFQSGDILYVKGSRGMRLEELVAPWLDSSPV